MAINATQSIVETLVVPSGAPIRITHLPIEILHLPTSAPIRATILTIEVLIDTAIPTPPEPSPSIISRYGPSIQVM